TAVNNGLTNTDVVTFAVSGSNIFAVTGGGVFLSTNSGSNWAAVDSGFDTYIYALAISDSNIFAGTATGVWYRPLSEMITAIKETNGSLPAKFSLSQNYPNPFNPTTTIRFGLKENSTVKLSIFNVLGQRVQELDLGRMRAGSYSQSVDMSRYASGVYLYRIDAMASDRERFVSTKKMVLIK
ncbi:MAG: T9SS type A sorting domain-containing protein, partial [Candidatus Kryptoniota bacterium]